MLVVVVVMVMLVETVAFVAITSSDGGSSRVIADVLLDAPCTPHVVANCETLACCNDGDGRST